MIISMSSSQGIKPLCLIAPINVPYAKEYLRLCSLQSLSINTITGNIKFCLSRIFSTNSIVFPPLYVITYYILYDLLSLLYIIFQKVFVKVNSIFYGIKF